MRRALLVAVVLGAAAARAQDSTNVSKALDAEAAFAASRRAVTLQETLALAAKNNLDLKAAHAAAQQVVAKAGLSTTAFLPEISVGASFLYTSAPAIFDNGGQIDLLKTLTRASLLQREYQDKIVEGLDSSPRTMTIQAAASLFGNITVQQVLFSPSFFLLPVAKEAKDAAALGTLEAREQVLLAAARVYLGLEGLEQLEVAAKEAEQVALKRERDAKAQVAVGKDTDIAVMRAQSETAQARATLASLSGNRVALLAMLEALTGDAVRPSGAPTQLEVTAADEAQAPWEALYAIKAAQLGVQSAERFNLVDRLAFLPTLVAQAKGNYNSNKGFVNTNFTFDAMVAAQWVIFDRGVRYVNMHENDAKTAQQRAQLDASRVRARANWIAAKTSLATAEVALEQAQAQAQLAERAQKQLGSAFQAGFATSLEVSDMDNKRFLAASAAAQARAQVQIRKVELAAAEGRLAKLFGLPDGVR